MEVSLSGQILFFLRSVIFGVFLGVLHDVFRIIQVLTDVVPPERAIPSDVRWHFPRVDAYIRRRKEGKHAHRLRVFLLSINEFFFLLTAALACAVFIYAANDGTFRFFALVGGIGGFAAYVWTIGKIVQRLSFAICYLLRAFVWYILLFICFPIGKAAGRAAAVCWQFLKKRLLLLRRGCGIICMRLYSGCCKRSLDRMARTGSLPRWIWKNRRSHDERSSVLWAQH